MPITASTIENLTVLTGSGGPTVIYTPSPAEIGRYRLRVVRVVWQGATGGDSIKIEGTTPTPGTFGPGAPETQTLALLVCSQGAGPAAAQIANTDQISFPDEAEFRGKVQATLTVTTGTVTVFLHHG